MSNSSKDLLCRGCGGTIGDHFAPDQGGCSGYFYIDGVMVFPVANRDAEIARLRAENDRLRDTVSYMRSTWDAPACRAYPVREIRLNANGEDDGA